MKQMNSYYGYDKPYTYVCYSLKDESKDIFDLLEKNNITCCFNAGQFNKKEANHIEAAYSVILLMSRNFLKESYARDVISTSVRFNKNILCIYLEELELDASLCMELNTQQAIFRYLQNDFDKTLLKAEVIRDMKITKAQKRFQKRRTLSLIIATVSAALLIFAIVVVPLLKQKEVQINENSLDLGDLSEEDLLKIESFSVLGNNGYDETDYTDFYATYSNNSKENFIYRYAIDYTNYYGEDVIDIGNISDISAVEKMKNAKVLVLVGQNISDITPILKLENLEVLVLDCNPISDISGISALKNLKVLSLNCTYIKDLSEVFTLPNLDTLHIAKCSGITSLKGIENSNITGIDAYMCSITEIEDLGYRNYGSVAVHCNYISDFSFITTAMSIRDLCISSYNVNSALEKVKAANVERLGLNDVRVPVSLNSINMPGLKGLTINGYDNVLTSLEGIDTYFPYLESFESVSLESRDFTPLLKCTHLGNVSTNTEYREEVYEQLVGKANFRIYLRDDAVGYTQEVTE